MNALAGSTSPYLLQHVDNPVAWEPWGPEALARARRDDIPIFLSVGYSACHWCHVMAHESFESDAIAALLNPNFVCIKVDREERPDVDAVYMAAVQLLTGRGGWPMSVFLTPDLEPFFAGTYWPPEPRHGMPGFAQVIDAVLDAWRQRRDQVARQAAEITKALAGSTAAVAGPAPSPALLDHAAATLERAFDAEHGGFGQAPKFPHPMDLRLLLRTGCQSGRTGDLEMATRTLDRMAAGGMHDHLGGGFARYSVDERWLVPHFEKMLSDNALVATAYLEGFLVTGRPEFAAVTRSTLDYVLRDMTDPAGGFWTAEDADSEGEEGRFYVWTPAEIEAALGPEEGRLACAAYGVTPPGNFEGRSILHLPRPLVEVARTLGVDRTDFDRRLAAARETLRAVRDRRVRPGVDDKVLVAWNGLAIDGLARAGSGLGEERYVAAAARAADFILAACRTPAGDLAHQWRRGTAGGQAFADDLACLAEGLASLYEATFAERWIVEACRLADRLVGADESGPLTGGGFVDPETGGFFLTSSAHERLIVRAADIIDDAAPGSTGMAATVLLRLAALTGRHRYRQAAERAIAAAASLMARAPTAVPQSLLALFVAAGPPEEFVVVGAPGAETAAVVAALRGRFRPHAVVALRAPEAVANSGPLADLFAGRAGNSGGPVLYRCRDRVCTAPAVGAEAVASAHLP